jgi:hypothetical protein
VHVIVHGGSLVEALGQLGWFASGCTCAAWLDVESEWIECRRTR